MDEEYDIQDDWVIFKYLFNEPLNNEHLDVISKYKKVKFGYFFNQSVDNLPIGVTDIDFGNYFIML